MDAEIEYLQLSNGVQMPVLGIGTSNVGGYSDEAVVHALGHCRVRHIDTARRYRCENLVGASLRKSGAVREEVFITSKVWPSDYGYHETRAAFQDSLKQVGVEYFDLYLLHWPNSPEGTDTKKLISESWKALEEFYSQGLCKAVGVSNFQISDLRNLEETWNIAPHVNQLEIHIFSYPEKLIEYCRSLGMQIVAYSPMAKGEALTHPRVTELATKYKRTSSQIVNRWVLQHGITTIPKSTKCHRVEENCRIFDFALTAEDMKTLDAIHETDSHSVIRISSPAVFNRE
ncbi:uncharacterized protein LOC110985199 isoform X1 [Acanthaster planci]|uniref:Uncharacterized protein LOC110985199 isoform X1 n=1 Tax=Acanthaster planci TaxID=133434 RepID=A0A8B7ZEU0_ACAPL|nr:uncharacterized protein LOC110985199 isoform X1 [Acanthaster planci]